ncbi:unnamed protein product [Dicrocoelium dendriticum]|nr:unnamed protein product [Dicrocoelium dendriticum]
MVGSFFAVVTADLIPEVAEGLKQSYDSGKSAAASAVNKIAGLLGHKSKTSGIRNSATTQSKSSGGTSPPTSTASTSSPSTESVTSSPAASDTVPEEVGSVTNSIDIGPSASACSKLTAGPAMMIYIPLILVINLVSFG